MFRMFVSRTVQKNAVPRKTDLLSTHLKYGYSTLTSKSESTLKKEFNDSTDMPNLRENPFVGEKPKCFLCYHNIEPNYKNVRFLSQFQSPYTGTIYPAAVTGLCKAKQKRVQEEIIKAQEAGLMAFMTKEPKYLKDPKLFNTNHKVNKTIL